MTRWLVIGSFLLTACTGDAVAPPEPASQAKGCPELPEGSGSYGFALWPEEGARDLVPELPVCATPTAPALFGLLNEQAGWSAGEMDAAALGVLHRDGAAIATFTTFRVAEDVPGFDQAKESLAGGGFETTEVGGLTLAWGAMGAHTSVLWIDGRDIVNVSAADAAAATEAAGLWLRGEGVDADVEPPEIPQLEEMPPALEAGPPLDELPAGYVAVGVDPISFMQSDFADSVTIFEEESVDALGAAVILSSDGEVVGTVVAGRGTPELGTWPGDFRGGDADVVAAGFSARKLGAFVVGYDQDDVDAFVDAWEEELSRS